MNDSILLDTSVVVAHLRDDASLANRLKESVLNIPLVALGGLRYGAERSSFQAKAGRQIAEFLRICVLLIPTEETAHHYGRINAQLNKSGTLIPQNDAWIAAIALEHRLPAATRDQHFSYVEG